MKTLFCTAEIHPFSRVGGLAEFSQYMAHKLAARDVELTVISPLYRQVNRQAGDITPYAPCERVDLWMGGERHEARYHSSTLPDSDIPVIFVECDTFFGRDGIYTNPADGKGFTDNHRRYGFFQLAVLHLLEIGALTPDLVHVNDHHTGLIPALIKSRADRMGHIKSIMTLHNIIYQIDAEEAFADDLGLSGLLFGDGSPYRRDGRLNFLKCGVLFADKVVAVSPTYADETRVNNELGYGLADELRDRGEDYFGILNGVDYSAWDPTRDDLIPKPYSKTSLNHKQDNKRELLAINGLDYSKLDWPVIGMITRLTDRKGFDMMTAVIDKMMTFDCYLVMLGTGEPKYHRLLESVKMRLPHKFGLNLSYSNKMAHLILAGSDFFLLPSRYEPCGQHQMYAMRFGAVPIAHATGGLADTIQNVDDAAKSGWGFTYDQHDPTLMLKTVWRAISTSREKKRFKAIVQRAMSQDFSWDRTADKYLAVYSSLVSV